jgi:predicted kinase
VEAIDLYQLHARDPKVPFETSVRALAALEREGKVRAIGLSNVRLQELELACEIAEIASVQVALSPLDPTPLKNGVAAFCAARGIPLLAHSPFGGYRNRGKLERHEALRRIAERRGISVQQAALAWLLALDPAVVPIAGASRMSSLDSTLEAMRLELTPEDLEPLQTREQIRAAPDGEREVVLLMGYPGAGKSTLAARWVERGYRLLSRDLEGGTIAGIRRQLDRRLSSGERRIVLDNTYPERASRFEVLETASRHGVPVTCVWLQTSLEQAQVNAVERMIEKHGRLLSPDEMASVSRKDPNSFQPGAQFRFREKLEPPRPEEGFARIETIAFVRRARTDRQGRGLFFDHKILLESRADVFRRYASEGFRLLGTSYEPGVPEEVARASLEEMKSRLGLDIDFEVCPHAPPAQCWCRKPLPGLGLLLIERHGLDPTRSLVIESSAADRGFAARLGIPTVSTEELFSDS